MKGHLRERSPGKWAIILDAHDPTTGKRKRKWHSFEGGKREAQKECARLINEQQNGSYTEPSKTTVAQFIARWLEHVKPQLSPKTFERYTEIVTKNLVPAVGSILLTKLRPAQISEAYAKALATGRRDGKGGLAPATVVYWHRLLKAALQQAVCWQMLLRNPAGALTPPKIERHAMQIYNIEQIAALLSAARTGRVHMMVSLAVQCGLRRGEIAALRWRHVDFAHAQLAIVDSVEQTKAGLRIKRAKSGKGRAVALSASLVADLRQHRRDQSEQLLRLGVGPSDESFVVAQPDGAPYQPRSLSRAWEQWIASTDLPAIRFHDLRHSSASLMLASGIHPKIVSERLGHSRIGITLDLYSHTVPHLQADAVATVDDALQAAIQRLGRTQMVAIG